MSDWLSGHPQFPMPGPNASKKPPNNKSTDLGSKLAKRKSQDFASKIKGWDTLGAGVEQQEDEIIVIEEKDEGKRKRKDDVVEVMVDVPTREETDDKTAEATTHIPSPESPQSPPSGAQTIPNGPIATSGRTAREVDLGRKAWVRRKSKPAVELTAEVKQATTPKKRVVSDGHWRKDRTSKPEPTNPEEATTKDDTPSKPKTIRRSVVSVGLKIPPSVQNFLDEPEMAPSRVRPIRRSRSGSRSRSTERDATPDYEDRGVKVYVKRRPRPRSSGDSKDPRTSESNLTVGSSIGKISASTDLTTPSQSPIKETHARPSTAPKEKTSRKSLNDETTPRRASRTKHRTPEPGDGHVREPVIPVLKPASKPAAPITPQVYGNRVQGWLAGVSDDPFTETRDVSLTPEPLSIPKKKSKKRLDDDGDMVQDEGDSGRRRSSGRRKRSRPSLETLETKAADGEGDNTTPVTPALRRSTATRKATHSPVKEWIERGVNTDVDQRDRPRQASGRVLGARPFPSTGNRLSTGASTDTLITRPHRSPSNASDQATIIAEGSVLSRASDGDVPRRQGSGLKRRATKHSDLISVLSLPRAQNAGIVSARSIRTHRHDLATATIGDLMNEVTTDELKYQRELRTLVGGVIPVLLTNVLQKTDASGTKRLFSGSSPDGQAVTKPIMDMGVALERLKSMHKRIPMHNPDELIRWAETATKAYSEYLKAWRLGFHDIIVNLAPAEGNEDASAEETHGLAAGDGERVDVAFLLKRPLVRLKYLAKTFKGIDHIRPSAHAESMSDKYHDLVQEARQRVNDERARLEDEAASSIDPTRARDPRSLAPLAGVNIDPTRTVRARDYFDVDLYHSSGQQLVCKIEVILRDDAPDRGESGDLLFCEVSASGRWLLFPPILQSQVSARPGDKDGEIIAMVRGMPGERSEWRELMSLVSSDDGTVAEWLDMLSSSPAPPRLTKTSSFNALRSQYVMSGANPDAGALARPPSPSEVDVPIGERATSAAQKWDGSDVNSTVGEIRPSRLRRAKAKRYRSTPSSPITEDSYEQVYARASHRGADDRYEEKSARDGRSKYDGRPKSSYTSTRSDWTATSAVSTPRKDYSVWLPSTERGSDESGSEDERHAPQKRPSMHRRTSSVPAMNMPTIPKVRKASQPSTPRQPSNHRRADFTPLYPDQDPTSAPAKLQKERKVSAKEPEKREKVDVTPSQVRPTSLGLRTGMLPSFTPAFLKRHRRSSSPLKHEYEPSTASESLSESDLSDVDEVESVTSESTVEEEAISTIGELKNFRNLTTIRPFHQPSPPRSLSSGGGDTLGPSESASQAPYRGVPRNNAQPAKTVASLFAWADSGTWDNLHPEECSIVVTPGLIEAFDITQADAVLSIASQNAAASPSQRGVKPLVALELTPLVPLRRGTAVDISIRSPPTPNSLIRTGSNIMFRSRNPEECERLYALINRARIDNPTYIALQNARGPTSNWAEVMDRRNSTRNNGSSWFRGSRKSSTYRSSGSRAVSAAATESSVNTMNTAFSALRRFSGSNRIFNIAKSTLTSREGTRSTYSDSLSSGAATPMPIDPSLGTPLGITNAKIRLYIRETASKWRDMGSARLTVMLPPRHDPMAAANPRSTGLEKRILICGKSAGEKLLDVTLGESCFERVARTGIAMSVWEETLGANGQVGIGAVGGVVSAKSKVYMIQMKSERDAAYTFGLVGKLRY